jgi:integrase
MTAASAAQDVASAAHTPLDPSRYDQDPVLRIGEREALAALVHRPSGRMGAWPRWVHAALARLVTPINDVLRTVGQDRWRERHATVLVLVEAMHGRQTAFWAWSRDEWIAVLHEIDPNLRHYAMAVAYLLCDYRDLHRSFPLFKRRIFAYKLFGRQEVDDALGRMTEEIRRWGYGPSITERATITVCELLLLGGCPHLEVITPALVRTLQHHPTSAYIRSDLALVIRALVSLGLFATSPLDPDRTEDGPAGTPDAHADVPDDWVTWCQRWYRTSTLTAGTRQGHYYYLLKVGRWLAATHPDATSPERWTRELAAAWVAAVDRMTIGDWTHAPMTRRMAKQIGAPLSARTKAHQLAVIRDFFTDCQEWEWIARRFDPVRAFATPRSIRSQIAPNPRVIADDVWAKLLWAGLNLTEEDVPQLRSAPYSWYPLEMVRAAVLVWLFAGLRVNELVRLRVGCIRWQRENVTIPGTGEVLSKDAVCLLDVPMHKTGGPFSKPVDRVVGEAISAWERIRPIQPSISDPKTGEAVHLLFAYRGQAMSPDHVNRCLIPLLCRKANIPTTDARGKLTSHRARSTIATQLFNAKEPMSLFELQAWLGHRTPLSTQHYAKVTPTKLAKSYQDAGYFGRNLRMIEVLVDQDVIKSGAAANGEPWRFYDLGHGYCTYDFFDQCPHRMACAKCTFYLPKGSTRAQLLEGKASLQRMLQEIPLTDDERAAVEEGVAAHEQLLAKLVDVPTPAGPTPRELTGEPIIPLRPTPFPPSEAGT